MRMKRALPKFRFLYNYLELLQENGNMPSFDPKPLRPWGSNEALQQAARRLAARKRLVSPRRGFYVIVPIEYRTAGAPPPAWFIDDLMTFQGRPYYVGLLSAAALHGAGISSRRNFRSSRMHRSGPRRQGVRGSASARSDTSRRRPRCR